MVCLPVCLSFVHCAQTAEDIDAISFIYDSPMSLLDRVKIWLTSVNHVIHKFCHKLTHPCWFERRRHSTAKCGRMARDIAMVTIKKPPSLFRTVPSLPSSDLTFSKNGGLKCTPKATSRRVLPPGEYDRKYGQGYFCIRAMSPISPNYFGPCHWRLLCESWEEFFCDFLASLVITCKVPPHPM